MIPPAFVRDFPLRLRNAGISEGMVYNAAPLNEFSPDSYPRGPIPFPRIEGLPDPLRPTYAQNEHTETTPSDYWHNQVQSPRLDSMTNDEGLTAVRNIVLHVAANMYTKRGKGDAHDPGPQSPPNVYGSKTESYVIRRSPESVTNNWILVVSSGIDAVAFRVGFQKFSTSSYHVQLLPRHDAPTDTEATAPDGKKYVCPQPECEQHFHKDTTRALVVEYLMYDHHTEFSALKGETRCPFGLCLLTGTHQAHVRSIRDEIGALRHRIA
ncbi:hypothetical protein D6D24_06629 [Aureobasidium pullulans]|uniref:Uncharacterized protein n=1 Tax=Aureobasidium pullulans TaxID=5580 RepID=A0A4S8VKA4_AURPU|nr:hypothetical protein D6D24_06629 [Aureobasidium pullulans]